LAIVRSFVTGSVGDSSLRNDDLAGVPHLSWSFDRTDIEAFIKAHVYLLDTTRMLRGHPFTNLALLENRAQA